MDKLQKIAALLRDKAAREYARACYEGESEAEFQGRLAYQQALETVAQVIEETCKETKNG